VVNATLRPLYLGKDPLPIVEEAGWAPGPVWTDAENLALRDPADVLVAASVIPATNTVVLCLTHSNTNFLRKK